MTYDVAAWKDFENEMVAHSKKFASRLCRLIGDEQLRLCLRGTMARADGYGFDIRGPVRTFVEMTFLFGSSFDTDPQYPWAAEYLRQGGTSMERAEALYHKILDYQQKVDGPKSIHAIKALRTLSEMSRKPLVFETDDFATEMLSRLKQTYPEKALYVGDAGLAALVREGMAQARRHGLQPMRGEAVLTAMMFTMGHGCTDDPLFPWLSRALADGKENSPVERCVRIETEAKEFMRRMGLNKWIFLSNMFSWVR
jgi:hypothetical protein